jgi:hypothetical protein
MSVPRSWGETFRNRALFVCPGCRVVLLLLVEEAQSDDYFCPVCKTADPRPEYLQPQADSEFLDR